MLDINDIFFLIQHDVQDLTLAVRSLECSLAIYQQHSDDSWREEYPQLGMDEVPFAPVE